jgi:hypothetical protein
MMIFLTALDFAHAVINGDTVAAVLFQQTGKFMAGQTDRHVFIGTFGGGDNP